MRCVVSAVLLASCAGSGETAQPSDTSAESCDPAARDRDWLGWTEPGSEGVSADEAFGFAVGTHQATLGWDDAVTSTVSVTFTPRLSYELRGDTCTPAIVGDIAWRVEDGARLSLSGDVEWLLETRERWPAPFAGLNATVEPADLGFEPLQSNSTFLLSTWFSEERRDLTFRLVESWPLEGAIVRTCTRAAVAPAPVGCEDVDTTPE
jgi:hypothetical protein